MGDLSEDARDEAWELYSHFEHADNGNDERALAAAIQRHMDATDKAEARVKELEEIGREHQSSIVNLTCDLADTTTRAVKAEARVKELEASKAELIREDKEWLDYWREMRELLAKHSGQP